MRIFTVGVGTAEGELIRVPDASHPGAFTFLKDDDGNVVKSRLNEAMLKEIAEKSGGFYMPLRGARPIETLYERGLAPLPKSDNASKMVRLYHEAYHWPLALAMALLADGNVFTQPQTIGPQAATTAPTPAFFAGLGRAALSWPSAPWPRSPRGPRSPPRSIRITRRGSYNQALREYDRLSRQNTNDFRLQFNSRHLRLSSRKI